jgi:hypothetical protein
LIIGDFLVFASPRLIAQLDGQSFRHLAVSSWFVLLDRFSSSSSRKIFSYRRFVQKPTTKEKQAQARLATQGP